MTSSLIFRGLFSLLFKAMFYINLVVDGERFQASTGSMTLCLLFVFPKVY